MSEAVFRAHIEQIWNNKDASGIERFISPDYRGHDPAEPEVISGIEGYKQHFGTLTTGFPDLRITIEDVLEVGERVSVRWFVQAVHSGDFGGIPPTGRRVRVTGISVARITRRQLIEEHGITDALGLLKQLGVIPESVKISSLLV